MPKRRLVENFRVTHISKDTITIDTTPREFEVDEEDITTIEIDFEAGTMRVLDE